ncbi:hypothetical protein [Bradyrhizobium sp. Ash2021]|uniref:hypothetical protein n=1 Tax=Bradyrhizobium sp. Ash2021 TaxID=2954771 RepID=UPI002815F11C|nr:hypothetical protein [Bradyrhizobium sp. Ash2021]WMT73175.1 hypothetical protein NL528_35205 [Bradyrhizobium sp. Ash2021]
MPAQHQRLDGLQQGLDPQQHRVHDTGGVDGMQHKMLNAPVSFAAKLELGKLCLPRASHATHQNRSKLHSNDDN